MKRPVRRWRRRLREQQERLCLLADELASQYARRLEWERFMWAGVLGYRRG